MLVLNVSFRVKLVKSGFSRKWLYKQTGPILDSVPHSQMSFAVEIQFS